MNYDYCPDTSDSDDLLAQMAADAAEMAEAIPDDDKLRTIGTLAAKQARLEQEVKDAEARLEVLKGELAQVAEHDLPEAIALTGLTEFKLEDGSKVEVGDDYYANIPSADTDKPELLKRRLAAFNWLRDNNHADLIKNEIKVSLTKGQDELAQRTMRGLDNAGIPYNNTEQVHHSTLKAFVREQVENGTAGFPQDTFGVCIKRVAKLKPASKSRKR